MFERGAIVWNGYVEMEREIASKEFPMLSRGQSQRQVMEHVFSFHANPIQHSGKAEKYPRCEHFMFLLVLIASYVLEYLFFFFQVLQSSGKAKRKIRSEFLTFPRVRSYCFSCKSIS